MNSQEKWIWLSRDLYPDYQTTKYSAFLNDNGNYIVAEFKKSYLFDKEIDYVYLQFSGDTRFHLYCNNEFLATGPACVGGDFLGNESPRPNFYSYEIKFKPIGNELNFFALVRMMPLKICEYSKGFGGFMLLGTVVFTDGTTLEISTDNTWESRRNMAFTAPYSYDARIKSSPFSKSEEIENHWNTEVAPIPPCTEEEILPQGENTILLKPHEEKEVELVFDKIYSAYIKAAVKTSGVLYADMFISELDESGVEERFVFDSNCEYRGLDLHSVGKILIRLKNDSDKPTEISISIIFSFFPVEKEAVTTTSDNELNLVLDTCRHTLKICRQTHHLDSPKHCEPLACTGDYYIETLMTAFSFGDMRLAEFDVLRTAVLLRNNDGRMFHTAYSLIWVLMLYDVYMFTGNRKLLEQTEDALNLLLNRFETYIGDNGLIETPPDYMFIDWIYIDEISMHHPPKALGQTCLNMFYYGALETAAKIYKELKNNELGDSCIKKSKTLKKAINDLLYDSEKELYFEGLNTETPHELLYNFMPQNITKRYYLKHSNILAAYFGICDNEKAKALLKKIVFDECEGDYQPYFAHYLLEAIYKNGLRDEYTLKILEKWKAPVLDCSKGLAEGFVKPEPTYAFDHSHAWGGTPLYSLPKALLGFEIKKAGMKEIAFNPSLLGLEYAKIEMPTPYGDIICELKKGEKFKIISPKEITVLFG